MHAHPINWRRTVHAAAALTLGVAGALVVFYAPVDPGMGLIQKLIYLHLPAAIGAFASAFFVFIASIAYLWTRRAVWNDAARAAGIATVVSTLIVLATGIAWARTLWGVWWTWSPRLTFTLVLFLLYAVYLGGQHLARANPRWTSRCAAYACVAFIDVPLVYLSIRLIPDVHPTSIPLTAEMRLTLLPCYALAALACAEIVMRAWAHPHADPHDDHPHGATPISGGRR